MNAAVVLLTSAWMAGADAAAPAIPAPSPAAAAMLAAPLGGCGNGCGPAGCSGAYDECPKGPRANLMDKLKSKFGHGGGCSSCGTAQPLGGYSGHHHHTPVYTGFTTTASDCCGSTATKGPGLLARLRARFSHGSSACTDPCLTVGCGSGGVAGCALPAAPSEHIAPAAPATPSPMPMPTSPEAKPATPKTTQLQKPLEVTPVSGPKTIVPQLGSSNSPF